MGEGPPYWTTYIAAADACMPAAARRTAAGGTTLVAPMDAMTFGRMAVFVDPVGAAF